MDQSVYLILENGIVFKGKSFGAKGDVTGEIVFTTAMSGYLETLTDPSYYGQFVIQTFPLIGNYGVIPNDFESAKPRLKAYIVRDWCQEPSNFRSEGHLDTFLKQNDIVGLYGIDTRALTKIVREYGVMNAVISSDPSLDDAGLKEMKAFSIPRAPYEVSCKQPVFYKTENAERHVALWDFGAKENIRRQLQKHGCNVTVVPADTTAAQIAALHPDGVMLSNGPGDPSDNTQIVSEIKKLFEYKIPTFGICLGHQLLALAHGAQTGKLKYGHRGANQPVVETKTGRVYITSQNHGYYVLNETLPQKAEVRFVNGNDGTCEGITYADKPVFSVQFHPEAAGGPLDTEFLFDEFVKLMKEVPSYALK